MLIEKLRATASKEISPDVSLAASVLVARYLITQTAECRIMKFAPRLSYTGTAIIPPDEMVAHADDDLEADPDLPLCISVIPNIARPVGSPYASFVPSVIEIGEQE